MLPPSQSNLSSSLPPESPVVVVGAGVGGLCAAIDLALHGLPVVVLEAAQYPGGKIRQHQVGEQPIDGGPTVLTLREVFDELFARAGERLGDHVSTAALPMLARHCWQDGSSLDLYADRQRSAQAIAQLAGPSEAAAYEKFCERSKELFDSLNEPFMRAAKPSSPISLGLRAGLPRLLNLMRCAPPTSLWRTLSRQFQDPRLRQLFGRYATYCGSSPFLAPSTLAVIAHVEQAGVWKVRGGLSELANALARLALRCGVTIRYGAQVCRIELRGQKVHQVHIREAPPLTARAVVYNGEVEALTSGLLGAGLGIVARAPARHERSLSAITWSLRAQVSGFALSHHTVFFAGNCRQEFDELFTAQQIPKDPTIYVCAMDRDNNNGAAPTQSSAFGAARDERLLCLVNAPATADRANLSDKELAACEQRVFQKLHDCGLVIQTQADLCQVTTPTQFAARFPASHGALYGRSTHGWLASFRRPASRSAISNLYLTGGGVHPGAGVPMAALSGRQAALSLIADLPLTRRSHSAVIAGGMSTSSAMTGSKG